MSVGSVTKLENKVIIECGDSETAGRWYEYIAGLISIMQEETKRTGAQIKEQA